MKVLHLIARMIQSGPTRRLDNLTLEPTATKTIFTGQSGFLYKTLERRSDVLKSLIGGNDLLRRIWSSSVRCSSIQFRDPRFIEAHLQVYQGNGIR
jgi:hypothetical protein